MAEIILAAVSSLVFIDKKIMGVITFCINKNYKRAQNALFFYPIIVFDRT